MRYLLKINRSSLSGMMTAKYLSCVRCPFSISNHLKASPHLLIIFVICIDFSIPIYFAILPLICVPCHFYHPCTSLRAHHSFTHSIKGDLSFQRGERSNLQCIYVCMLVPYSIVQGNTTFHDYGVCGTIASPS